MYHSAYWRVLYDYGYADMVVCIVGRVVIGLYCMHHYHCRHDMCVSYSHYMTTFMHPDQHQSLTHKVVVLGDELYDEVYTASSKSLGSER